jgi:uncharacterized protein YbjT (DUF2867 family)
MLVIVAAYYLTPINNTVLFWLAFILTRPLGAAGGDALTKPADEGGLGWGTLGGSAALFALLVTLTIYQIVQIRRHPLQPLRYPINRLTGQPQHPNGEVIERVADQRTGTASSQRDNQPTHQVPDGPR